jgi:hypothetical protein
VAARFHNDRIFIAIWRDYIDADARDAGRGKGGSADAAIGRGMNHWPYITAAYVLAIIATLGVTGWSLFAMRRAEKAVDDMKGDQ